MSEHAIELAQRFETTNGTLIAFIEGCSDEQLATVCPDAQQTVAALAYHVADHFPYQILWLQGVANGTPITTHWEQIHALNAREFAAHQQPTRGEVLELLRANGAKTAEAIRSLNDEQLATSAPFAPAENRPMSAEHIVRLVIMHHIKDHLKSMRAIVEPA